MEVCGAHASRLAANLGLFSSQPEHRLRRKESREVTRNVLVSRLVRSDRASCQEAPDQIGVWVYWRLTKMIIS